MKKKIIALLAFLAAFSAINAQESIVDTTIIHRTVMDMRLVRLNYIRR